MAGNSICLKTHHKFNPPSDRSDHVCLGILDRDHIGLYAINVDAKFRCHHLGRAVCQEILKAGIQEGAKKAYLQVVPDNLAAKNLYRSLGFQDTYTHWFRSKSLY